MFSNSVPSASAWEPGAVVISTMPPDFDAGLEPTSRWSDPSRRAHGRETPDPDDFRSGFGVGSGTSYAAPAFAAKVARQLLLDTPDLPPTEDDALAAKRCARAVQAVLDAGAAGS